MWRTIREFWSKSIARAFPGTRASGGTANTPSSELGSWITLHHSPTDPSWWKTRAIGLEPPKGYLLKEASLSSNPKPGFEGSGKRPLTMRIAGKPNHSAQIFSLSPGCTKLQISWMRKFGIEESTCNVAVAPMGPSHACGAIETLEMLAMAPTFQSPVI